MERARLFDLAVTLVAAAIGVGLVVSRPPLLEPVGGATLALQVGLALALLVRRRAPVLVCWAAVGVAAVLALGSGVFVPDHLDPQAFPWMPAAAPFAAYAAAAWSRHRLLAFVPVVALVAVTGHFWDQPPNSPWPFQSVVFGAVPALVGLYLGARRRLVQSLLDERHLLAEQARADERARLAAEMHDLVTHRVSLMVLQAGALSSTTGDVEVRAAADDLRTTGCQALDELRDLVSILRDGDAPAALGAAPLEEAPAPDLRALVDDSGVTAELVQDGDPSRASPVVGRTTYRIVQEALTNIHKHAPGARAVVHLRYAPDGVRLTVRNTAPQHDGDPLLAASGSGTGLFGLRQRVELINGTLEAGPTDGGGFLVDARLPAYVAS